MPTSRLRRAATATAVVAALALAACTNSPTGTDGRPGGDDAPMRLYGTDGVMSDDFAAAMAAPTMLAGMKGTRPMPVLPAEFLNRLREVDPSLQNFLFAGETYDAVVISAIAAELAGTPDPEVVRTYIIGATTDGQRCRTVADCLELARDGEDLAYRGVALTDGLTDQGEPAATTYETAHFGVRGGLDPDRSEFIAAGDVSQVSRQEAPPPRPRVDLPAWEVEPLVLGGLLPETGALSFAHPVLYAAAQLAVQDINAAGGVFGVDVEWVDGDSGTDPDVARGTVASHVDDGVHILIGPGASGVAEAIMPDVVAAGRILFSATATAAGLINVDHRGYFFRTAPPDSLQGAALADVLLRDGIQRVVLVARDDAYGRGLLGDIVDSLRRFGVDPELVTSVTYTPPTEPEADLDDNGDGGDDEAGGDEAPRAPAPIPDLDAVVAAIVEARADGLVVIGFAEAAQLVERLVADGVLGG